MSHGHVASELGAAGGRREHGQFVATREVADHTPEGEQRLPVDAEGIDGNGVERGEHCRHVADHLGTHGAGHRDEAISPRLPGRLQLGRPGDERWQLRRAPLNAQDIGELVDHRDLAGGVARRTKVVDGTFEEVGRGRPERIVDPCHETAQEQTVRFLAPLGRECIQPCGQHVRANLRVPVAAARPQDVDRLQPELVRRAQPSRPVVLATPDELRGRPCHGIAPVVGGERVLHGASPEIVHDQLAVACRDQWKLGEQLEVSFVAGIDCDAQQFAIARSDGGRHRENPAMTLVEMLEDGLPYVVAGAVDAVRRGDAGDGGPAPAAGDHLEVGAVDGGQLPQFGRRQGQLPLADVPDLPAGAQRSEPFDRTARRQHEVHWRRCFGDELGEQPASLRGGRDVVGIVDHHADAEWPAPGELAEQRAEADRRRAGGR